MDIYLNTFRKMLSLRGLTEHTLTSYCTYIRAYLDHLSDFLHKTPRLGWERRLTCHSFRHLYEDGVDLLTIKALMGHRSIQSTTIYVHLASNGTGNAVSPFDRMAGVCHECGTFML